MKQKIFQIKFEAMGTKLEIDIWDKMSELLKSKLKIEILDFTDNFDKLYSRFRKDSLTWEIYEKGAGVYEMPEDLVEMLQIYKILNEVTDGAVNPYVGNTISDLGYDYKYTLRPKENIRFTPKFNDTIALNSPLLGRGARGEGSALEIKQNVLIDIGAIGKGFWVDKVCEILKKII